MAETKDEKTASAKNPADVQRAGSQPEVVAGPQKPDTANASPDAARAAMMATAQPFTGAVAMVSRDGNGNPAENDNFIVLVPEGATQAERDAAWNRSGEAQGAQHVKHSGGERTVEEHTARWNTGFTDEERAERAKTEARELHRHNFREELKA